MFRTVFKSAVRHASLPRGYSTRAARPLYSRNLILGASLVASSLAFLPLACVDNDADQAKVESDKKSTKLGDHKGESTYNVEDSSTKPSEVIPEDHPDKSAKRKSSEKEFSNKEKNDSSENKIPESSENKATPNDDNAGDHEGEQSAAYNPETGEINWDCPCLGGMAHGPCGEEFKAAFSCFIYSETEPKGIDCIQKFEGMRTCFRQYPEHYKEELYEDDEPVPSTDSDKPQDSEPKVSEKEAPKESATEDISKVA